MTEDYLLIVSEPGLAMSAAVIDRRFGDKIRFAGSPRNSAGCLPVS